MTSRQPPRVATWVLLRVAPQSRHESLIGDMEEQYRRGRSRGWYWRQVLAATVAGVFEEIRDHPYLTARALLLGWTLRWVGKYFGATLQAPGTVVSLHIGNWLQDTRQESMRFWLYRSHAFDLPRWGIWWIACVGIGWTISYTHRVRQPAILVLVFASSVLVAVSPWIASNLGRNNWDGIYAVTVALMGCASTIAGGLWGADSLTDDHAGTVTE